jgi:hypothetical protein
MFVLGQLLLCQSKSFFTHQRRNGHFNPVGTRSLTMAVGSIRNAVLLTKRSGDALPR